MNNMVLWDIWKQPPEDALKEIRGGRMKGKTDISPQWRYKVLTERFGPVGFGWKYEIERVWSETGSAETFCFAIIKLYLKGNEGWSEPIFGIGGSKLVQKEHEGLYDNDEGYKMAVTDAISVAAKCLGIGANIYEGKTKYSQVKYNQETTQNPEDMVARFGKYKGKTLGEIYFEDCDYLEWLAESSKSSVIKNMAHQILINGKASDSDIQDIKSLCGQNNINVNEMLKALKIKNLDSLPKIKLDQARDYIKIDSKNRVDV